MLQAEQAYYEELLACRGLTELEQWRYADVLLLLGVMAGGYDRIGGNASTRVFTTRREAFNAAKDRAGIPRSQQPVDQWTVGNDIQRSRTSNYRYSNDPGTHGWYYAYNTPQGRRVIVEHTNDPNHPYPHFHAGEVRQSAQRVENIDGFDFRTQRYTSVGGAHHYYYQRKE
ncbi:hypothetical protein HC928_09640 [bacterium]|nr:hypothetical protein [bacterium]